MSARAAAPLSIVLPVYNEEDNLEPLHARLSTELKTPSRGTVRKYTGAISQCTLNA